MNDATVEAGCAEDFFSFIYKELVESIARKLDEVGNLLQYLL